MVAVVRAKVAGTDADLPPKKFKAGTKRAEESTVDLQTQIRIGAHQPTQIPPKIAIILKNNQIALSPLIGPQANDEKHGEQQR